MGCGASSTNDTAAGKKGNEVKYEQGDKSKSPKTNNTTEDQPKKVPPPAQTNQNTQSPQKAAAPTQQQQSADASEGTSAGREKNMPGPIISSLSDAKETQCIVSAMGNGSDMTGLITAVYNTQTHEVYSSKLDDAELTKVRDNLSTPPLQWPTFWKLLAAALTKSDIKVNKECTELDIRLKQSKGEPKEASLKLKLQPSDDLYDSFLMVVPRIFSQKRNQIDGESKEEKKDDKKSREADISKKEAEYNIHESVLLAGIEAEQLVEPRVQELRQEAKKSLRHIGELKGRIAKTKQELETLQSGAPSHPLDNMYGCVSSPLPEPSAVNPEIFSWETDAFSLEVNNCDVALALFEKHGLVEAFNMDRGIIRNFFHGVQVKCCDVPFHGRKRSLDCMIVMDHILVQLEKTVKFSKEDIFAGLLSAAILDIDHDGYDDCFVKRAGAMLSMLYSDVYSINQNNLTTAAEMFFNDNTNILLGLTPDQNKDVVETMREALFIKANVQMKTPLERLSDFKQLVGSGNVDWANKDNIRHAITHALRMADWSAWGRPPAIHKKMMDMLAEEYYRQGDKELSLGLAPSHFHNTIWTTDRSAHESTFSKGQVQFIDEVVLPLFEEMTKLAPGLQSTVDFVNANKDALVKEGGAVGDFKATLAKLPKLFTSTKDGMAFARVGSNGLTLWVTFVTRNKLCFCKNFDSTMLCKRNASLDTFLDELTEIFKNSSATTTVSGDTATLHLGKVDLELPQCDASATKLQIMPSIKSFFELRGVSVLRHVERKIEDVASKASAIGNKADELKGEEKALKGCVVESERTIVKLEGEYKSLTEELTSKGGREVSIEVEDALSISVRNPLKAPLPPGVTVAPDCKEVDVEVLKLIKSKYFTKEHGAAADLTEQVGDEAKHCNCIKPYLTSEFAMVTSSIEDTKRQKIWTLLQNLDEWDYDVFDLQTVMSGGISGENLRNQPEGGSLFITAYALMFKWQFMQKFNIDEQVLLNWLSIVEAGYHPNPYHNSMHAADVLHVTHYILGPGGCKDRVKATDEEVFAAIFAAAVHDYNHPGINNAFHVRSQNYLAVLFNDRSVNENIHTSSIFELMRMDKFNILNAFTGSNYTKMRDDIVEFVLGTDMGLHAMILSRFKKRLETTDGKMHKSKADKNLAITMCVKMADINNCGRPQKLYHGWCNVIVDEFFQQGDRERLAGLPVSPFMDRFTTIMAKGQIGFMNYIVMPLFECMGEFLDHMAKASSLAEENRGFWQENEDW